MKRSKIIKYIWIAVNILVVISMVGWTIAIGF